MPRKHDYDDDIFADSRMSFGEHIEELRTHLLRALKGLAFFLVIGFVLDTVGAVMDWPWLGIGRPMVGVITAPVKAELRAFYDRRMARLEAERDRGEKDATRITEPQPLNMTFGPEALRALGVPNPDANPVSVQVLVDPVQVFKSGQRILERVRPPELTTLSATEAMVVYIKVALLCSLVIASPWVFWQLWSFIAAGLYPHEKRYVHRFLPLSVGLFLGGVFLCQFAVIPQSVAALLWFNDWLGFTPDLRLSEWLGFAVLLPLVFGISFQTPLVMLILERIGIMTVDGYWKMWRIAAFALALAAAIITPTPDAITMLAMWIPLLALYFLGIYLCQWSGQREEIEEPEVEDALIES